MKKYLNIYKSLANEKSSSIKEKSLFCNFLKQIKANQNRTERATPEAEKMSSLRLTEIKCSLEQPEVKPITVIQIGLGPIGMRMIA